jgi:hypothetical protein
VASPSANGRRLDAPVSAHHREQVGVTGAFSRAATAIESVGRLAYLWANVDLWAKPVASVTKVAERHGSSVGFASSMLHGAFGSSEVIRIMTGIATIS